MPKWRMNALVSILLIITLFVGVEARRSDSFNPYSVLGISQDASQEEIRRKYKKLCLKYHPDKNVQKNPREKKRCEELFQHVQKANDMIGSEESRRLYKTSSQFQQSYTEYFQRQPYSQNEAFSRHNRKQSNNMTMSNIQGIWRLLSDIKKKDVLLIGLVLYLLFRKLRSKKKQLECSYSVAETTERERELNEEMRNIRLQQQKQITIQAVEAEKIRQTEVCNEKQRKAQAVIHKHLQGGKRLGGTGLFQRKKKNETIMKNIRLQQQQEANRLATLETGRQLRHDNNSGTTTSSREKTTTATGNDVSRQRNVQQRLSHRSHQHNNVHTLAGYPGQSTSSASSSLPFGGRSNNWNTQGTRFMTADDRWAQAERATRLRRNGSAPPPPGQAPSSRGNWGR